MANPIALNDVLRCSFMCSFGQQQSVNVIHYQVTAVGGVGPTDQTVADTLSNRVAPLYKAWFNLTTTYRGTRVQVIVPVVRPAVVSSALAGVGVAAGDVLPTQSALLLSNRTNTAGKRGRGRTYLPFFTEAANDITGRPDAASQGQAGAWATSMLGSIVVTGGGGNVTLSAVVYSKKPPATALPITQVLVRSNWATQRRRSQINRGDQLF